MCEDCRNRFEKNPLRLLDCKNEACKEIAKDAPTIVEHLCGECESHFERLQHYLRAMGIDYKINPYIVRGLDYYTKTVFEIISNHIGAQGTVCGGGRYDKLVEELGGPAMPGVGFGMGMERLLLVMEGQGIVIPEPTLCDVFFCTYGDAAKTRAVQMAYDLRKRGVKAEVDHVGRSMKAQFKFADKIDCKYVVVIGDEELEKGSAKLKEMETGVETLLTFEEILGFTF